MKKWNALIQKLFQEKNNTKITFYTVTGCFIWRTFKNYSFRLLFLYILHKNLIFFPEPINEKFLIKVKNFLTKNIILQSYIIFNQDKKLFNQGMFLDF